jgi:hypothetical protein
LEDEKRRAAQAVEILWSQYVHNKKIDARFWSPFRQPGDPWWATDDQIPIDPKVDPPAKVVAATRAIDEHARRVNDALIEAARQPSTTPAATRPHAPPKRRSRVIALVPRSAAQNDLKKGADLLDEL